MTHDAYLTLAILVVTFGLLIKTKLPAVAVFMGALGAAITLHLAPTDELLKGFSNQGMLTVAVLYIVAAGMYATGAITMLMNRLIGLPKHIMTAQIKILPPIAVGSAFLNNTPLVAMMIPVIRDLTQSARLPGKHLYLPLSFASILGGVCTIIGTSTNLVVVGLVADVMAEAPAGLPAMRPLKMFDPAWVGVPAALIGIAFMITFGRFLLPRDADTADEIPQPRKYKAEFEVEENSRLIGKSIADSGIIGNEGVALLSIRREDVLIQERLSEETIQAGDLLSFSANVTALTELWRTSGLIPHLRLMTMKTPRHTHQLAKAVVSRQSRLVGRKLNDLPNLRSPYQFKIVALSRDGQPVRGLLENARIEAGDKAVFEVNDTFFYESYLEHDFTLTKPLEGYHLQRTNKAVEASMSTLAMITVVALGLMSMLNAALLASGLMLAFGCLSLRTAGRSIDWATLVVIACAISLESAVKRSGLADQIAGLMTAWGGDNPYLALGVIYLGCTFMTNVITNNAAAAFMFPIALSTAAQLDINFMPFAVTLMVASSCAFITPTGYQTNLMVWGPGGYAFGDFAKIGTVMTLIVATVTLVLVPLVFRF
ncbi:MAG: SLC13 family permease [Desulfobacterales bacterium]|nr:SLC13 family permease [Desulfobacterales bacterium]